MERRMGALLSIQRHLMSASRTLINDEATLRSDRQKKFRTKRHKGAWLFVLTTKSR
jgi:hypothetical protein